MECFFTALRVYSSSKKNVSDAEDAFPGSPSSSSMFLSQEDHGATSHLKRQRAAAFLRIYVCGMKSITADDEALSGNAEFLFKVGSKSEKEQSRKCNIGKEALEGWEEGGKKRRKLGSEEWVAGDSNGNLLRRVPARWKRLIRRVRAKVRKMGQVQKAASFHYDPLSYSMNFDDGCWQHSEARPKLFHTPSLPDSKIPRSS